MIYYLRTIKNGEKKRNSRHIGTKHERSTPINRTYYEPHEDT